MSSKITSGTIRLMALTFLTAVILTLLFGNLVGWGAVRAGLLKFESGATSLTLSVEDDFESVSVLLEKIFGENQARREAVALLENHYDLFDITETRFVRERIANLDPDDPVSLALLDLKKNGSGPFREVARSVRISFPQNPRFPHSEAAVLRSSSFRDEKLHLYDSKKKRYIEVHARNFHSRVLDADADGTPPELIQITPKAGRDLFGRSTLAEIEGGYAVILY